jgi:type IV pilus assembly protein PilA
VLNTRLSRTCARVASAARQQGFTLIEVSVVAVVLVVLVALAVPKIEEKLIEGRIPPAGRDLALSIARMRALANMAPSTTPFATLPAMDALFKDGNFTVTGTSVGHQLGANGGEVVVTSIASGASVAFTVWGLHHANCPALSNQLHKAADVLEVGTSGTSSVPAPPSAPTSVPLVATATVVKTPTSTYDGGKVAAACSEAGRNNYLRFYVIG